MPLSKEQIDVLLAQAAQPKRGGKRVAKPIERTHGGWFALHHKLMDSEENTPLKCENPNCIDPRSRDTQVCAQVNGKWMCRFCFIDGWLSVGADQETLV